MPEVSIKKVCNDDIVNLVSDTIEKNKQALVFVNTKRSAEKVAEDIARKLSVKNDKLKELKEQILNVLSKPTRQCERLAFCIAKGFAFHHSGLAPKQKELIEDAFRNGVVKTIACTPTLCLSEDTKLWCETSEIAVKDFNISKKVLALTNHNNLISLKLGEINKLENNSDLVEIRSVSGYCIKLTENHKVLIKRDGKRILINSSECKKNDKIATIGELEIKRAYAPSYADFLKDNSLSFVNKKLDKEEFYLIGAMLGDGYSGAEKRENKIIYKGSPSIVGRDQEIFDKISKYCEKNNLFFKQKINFNKVPYLALSKQNWFREFLARCGVNKGENKFVSHILMNSGLELIKELIRGLFDTDGYVQKGRNIGFSSISPKLIECLQKLLLRFGIICAIRKRNPGKMKINLKEYATKSSYELIISNKRCIVEFYMKLGFGLSRKQNDLLKLVAKIFSNIHYSECKLCDYKIYKDLFSGRSKDQKKWGKKKLKVIKLLGEKGELGSKELVSLLKYLPRAKDLRLNHHYELIKKKRIGNRSATEMYWSLNKIGLLIYNNLLKRNKNILEFFKETECPLCRNNLNWKIKKGWRDKDFENHIYWDIVREVKKIDGINHKHVYDVVLPNIPKNDHMFVANGFIVHNSAGLDMPAFRAIIRDVKRYTSFGMDFIPVLEYLQMAGRAGRPKYDDYGEAIVIVDSEGEREMIDEKFIHGIPEDITSKLAVEPVLRTYILSLIATNIINSKEQIEDFFSRTFWAKQYGDLERLNKIIDKMLKLLIKFELIHFVDEKYRATYLGVRVSQLYLDPLTANQLVIGLKRISQKALSNVLSTAIKPIALLQIVCNTLEMRPLLNVKTKEFDDFQEKIMHIQEYLLDLEPSQFEPEYEEWLNSIKTAFMLNDWIEEKDEEYLLETYDTRPGELNSKLENTDWLLYSLSEIAKIMKLQPVLKEIMKLRFRVKYGAKEELLTLLKLKGIGRVRARKMFSAGLKELKDVKDYNVEKLAVLIGKQTAESVRKQLVNEEPMKNLEEYN